MLELSPLRETDRPVWDRLVRGYMAFYKTARTDSEYDLLWSRLQEREVLCSFGARRNGVLVGFTHYLFHGSCWSPDVCYLQDLFVDESQRGQGIGKALIERVAEAARARGSPRLYWLTQSANEVARRLYDQVASHTGFIRYEKSLADDRA